MPGVDRLVWTVLLNLIEAGEQSGGETEGGREEGFWFGKISRRRNVGRNLPTKSNISTICEAEQTTAGQHVSHLSPVFMLRTVRTLVFLLFLLNISWRRHGTELERNNSGVDLSGLILHSFMINFINFKKNCLYFVINLMPTENLSLVSPIYI